MQIDYVAAQIDLPMDKVLIKLSEMILDEKIRGTLDQGRNCLIIFEEQEPTEMFDHSLQTIKNLDTVMDSLYEKVHLYRQKYIKWSLSNKRLKKTFLRFGLFCLVIWWLCKHCCSDAECPPLFWLFLEWLHHGHWTDDRAVIRLVALTQICLLHNLSCLFSRNF